MHDARAAVNFK